MITRSLVWAAQLPTVTPNCDWVTKDFKNSIEHSVGSLWGLGGFAAVVIAVILGVVMLFVFATSKRSAVIAAIAGLVLGALATKILPQIVESFFSVRC